MVFFVLIIHPSSGVQPRDQLMCVIIRLSLHRMMRDAYMTLCINDCQGVYSWFFCMVLHVIVKWFQRPYNFEGGIAAMNEWYVQLQALCINDCQCGCIVTVIFKVQRRPTPLNNCRMVNSYTCVILWVVLEAYCYEDSKYVINFMIGCELATIPPYLIGNPGQNSKPFSKYNVGLHH